MLLGILNICSKEELQDDEPKSPESPKSPIDDAAAKDARRQVIKNKILAVGKMSRVFSVLREESERITELKNFHGTGKLPYGTLALGAEGIKSAIHNFDEARKSDIENERLPPTRQQADEIERRRRSKDMDHAIQGNDKRVEEIANRMSR